MLGIRKWRRRRLLKEPMLPEWLAIIERNVPYYHLLPAEHKTELQALTRIFLAEKSFEGCGGLLLTDEMRITIAAQGCILLLGRETDIYPKLRSVLVYPHDYIARICDRQPDGTVVEGWQGRSGESWMQGYVVLSWEDVLCCGSNNPGWRNVVLHEFAHQLDNESGASEGAPLLPRSSMAADWARVFEAAYQALRGDVEHNRPTLLDAYGALSPAEFFAVATECFFEQPGALKEKHPALYEQLMLFYSQDPASLIQRRSHGA